MINVLKRTLIALEKKDVRQLKILSDHAIISASTFQDEYSVSIAVLIYSLSKILERGNYGKMKGWSEFYKMSIVKLKSAKNFLEKNNINKFDSELREIFKGVNNLSSELKNNIKDVFEKAKINKASKLYEQGISVGRTAKLLGVSHWDLINFSGTKEEIGEKSFSKNIRRRINYARSLFR